MPLAGIVSRFTEQKGLDLVVAIADELASLPLQLAVLGSGEAALESAFDELARRRPDRFAVRLGFDEGLAHRIEAGADLFLMPSRFEPCGLNQMYSLRYGTPPVVHATGGLADTVIDAADAAHGNGFVFAPASAEALLAAVRRAVSCWRKPPQWRALQRRGMSADFGWATPVRHYLDVYSSLLTPTR
jgi:starch synthase